MDAQALDNPIWSALQTSHARLSLGNAALKRYPTDVVPFAAVASDEAISAHSLAQVLENDAAVYFIGKVPLVEAPWVSEPRVPLVQMICAHLSPPSTATAEVTFRELEGRDGSAMLALTEQVFPGYFRKSTLKMGRYYGVFEARRLVAMSGERLAMQGFQEVSAVCTHPDYAGRGYASALIRHVAGSILARRDVPFLHVAQENERARALYRALGFSERGTVAWSHVSLGARQAPRS